jgi:hypothetical protein
LNEETQFKFISFLDAAHVDRNEGFSPKYSTK